MGVPQYHPGKVMDVYSGKDRDVVAGDAGVQAMVKMWDGHTLVINVHPKLKGRVKPGDTVLVDYYPSKEFKTPLPKILVTKILHGDKARKIVEEYKAYYKRMGSRRMKKSPAEQPRGRYIG